MKHVHPDAAARIFAEVALNSRQRRQVVGLLGTLFEGVPIPIVGGSTVGFRQTKCAGIYKVVVNDNRKIWVLYLCSNGHAMDYSSISSHQCKDYT